MFSSVFLEETNVAMIFLMLGIALVCGVIYSYIVSFKLRS